MTELTLNLIELFASVQGETSLSGLPTTFVRLAACNLRCTWCDTTYSFGRGTPHSLTDIIAQIQQNNCQHVCITGGEPLLQPNVHALMSALCDLNYIVSIETSGSLTTHQIDPRVRTILDIKCPGSGMSDKNLWSNLDLLKPHDEIKCVLLNETDYNYAVSICRQHNLFSRAHVLFSPVHGVLDPKSLIAWILRDQLPVRINLQLHKFIWGPHVQGV